MNASDLIPTHPFLLSFRLLARSTGDLIILRHPASLRNSFYTNVFYTSEESSSSSSSSSSLSSSSSSSSPVTGVCGSCVECNARARSAVIADNYKNKIINKFLTLMQVFFDINIYHFRKFYRASIVRIHLRKKRRPMSRSRERKIMLMKQLHQLISVFSQ